MIRAALPSDLDAIEEIYDALFRADERRGKSFTNWQRGLYPTRDTARKAGKAGTLYVYEMGGDIAGAVNLNQIQPNEYAQIPWTIPAKGSEVLVIHTLTVHPVIAGKGIGRQMVAFAEGLAAGRGYKAIRLDTYEGNEPARRFYEKLGYHLAGSAPFHFEGVLDETLVCYEKEL